MGVGIVSTRPINQGEQIFISYSGDETIEDTWGEVFSCYCCHCQKSCRTRGRGPLGSKRKEPTSHQGIRESEPEQSPKKARLRFHTPDKRKREDKETMDLEPVKKKSAVPQCPRPLHVDWGIHTGQKGKTTQGASSTQASSTWPPNNSVGLPARTTPIPLHQQWKGGRSKSGTRL